MMRYKRGDYFGELALLNDAPRAATVTALTKCKVVSINRDQFKVCTQDECCPFDTTLSQVFFISPRPKE